VSIMTIIKGNLGRSLGRAFNKCGDGGEKTDLGI
jgi:hypothetical protein